MRGVRRHRMALGIPARGPLQFLIDAPSCIDQRRLGRRYDAGIRAVKNYGVAMMNPRLTRRVVIGVGLGMLLDSSYAPLASRMRYLDGRQRERGDQYNRSARLRDTGWMPEAARKEIDKNFNAGGRSAQRGLILHVQEGEGSLFDQFSTPATKASAHFWISKAGEIEQYVSVHDVAWSQRAGNAEWVSVETSGFSGIPLTDPQIVAVARIYAWGRRTLGWPLTVTDSVEVGGLGTHSMGVTGWGGHDCPGKIRSAQRQVIMTQVCGMLKSASNYRQSPRPMRVR
ncbi:peptidoglycan recognition protein family protein [Streptomyces noursei]|uniref:peptidoglycan recognition protein family protein n=1 Tax=Streptomyces noursei TaxID=1971 RepID=UPI000C9A11F9